MAKGQIKQKQDNINKKQFEALCAIQCTQEEILSVLDMTDKTLNSWCKSTYGLNFSDVFKQKRQGGKASLRRMQWKLAENNVTMGIWLGKQYLGQSDVIEKPDNEQDNSFVEALNKKVEDVWNEEE